jgi:hypothetical protein
MSEPRDPVRSGFDALRADDHAHAVPFDALVQRPRGRRPRRASRTLLLAIAGVGAAAVFVTHLAHRTPPPVPVSELVAWRAPSDVLLAQATNLYGVAPLGASALDAFLPPRPDSGARR